MTLFVVRFLEDGKVAMPGPGVGSLVAAAVA
jgi:hypothetical protein